MGVVAVVEVAAGCLQRQSWPETFDFTHYTYVLTKIPGLPQNLSNSLLVTFGSVVLTCVCAVMAAMR